MKDFAVIALIALAITIVVTIIGTTLLLRQVKKPESQRKGEIFQPEHIDDPQTEEDWKKWDDDDWNKDEWEDQWKNWDFDKHAPAENSGAPDAPEPVHGSTDDAVADNENDDIQMKNIKQEK